MRRLAVALVAASAMAAPGCGSDAQPFSLASVVDNAKGESSRGTMVMKVTGKEAFDMDARFVASGDGETVALDGVMTTGGEKLTGMKMRGIGEDVWVTAKEFAGNLPGGKRWIHASNSGPSFEAMSPAEFVEFMREAKGVEEVGEEDVAGQPATRYSGTVSLKKLAEETGGGAAAQLRALGIGDKPIPMDVWVSEKDLPVRIRADIELGGTGVFIDATMEEYGVEVDVKPPPKRDVIEEKDLG